MDSSSSNDLDTKYLDWKISIDLAKRALEKQEQSIESFKSTIQTLITSSSIVISLFSATQLIIPSSKNISPEFFKICIFLAIIFYGIHFVISIYVLLPTPLKGPSEPSWEIYDEKIIGKLDIDNFQTVLISYINAHDENKEIVIKLRNLVKYALCTFSVVIIILLSLSMIEYI